MHCSCVVTMQHMRSSLIVYDYLFQFHIADILFPSVDILIGILLLRCVTALSKKPRKSFTEFVNGTFYIFIFFFIFLDFHLQVRRSSPLFGHPYHLLLNSLAPLSGKYKIRKIEVVLLRVHYNVFLGCFPSFVLHSQIIANTGMTVGTTADVPTFLPLLPYPLSKNCSHLLKKKNLKVHILSLVLFVTPL